MRFRTLDAADVKGKRVLVRVDFNVPMQNGEVADVSRIERNGPTITEIADRGGKVILLSHYGRPKGRDPKESLKPVVAAVARIIGRPIAFADDCAGEVAEQAVARMKPGEILCLENTRFYKGEEKNDPALAAALAKLGDIYVDDAFSVAHRAHASVEAIAHLLPAYAGRAMQEELAALEKALHTPQRPVAAVVGGAKVSTKLDLLGNLLNHVDTLIIGGGMANTFLAAQGKAVGKSLCENDLVQTARDILAKANSLKHEIALPVDVVVAQTFAAHAPSRVVSAVEVAEAVAELTAGGKLVSIAGGGDTMAALNLAGVTGRFTYVSTAGGAFLEWLEGKVLPGVEVLKATPTPATAGSSA